MPEFASEEGGISFTDIDLEAMGNAVLAGEAEPHGTVILVGLSERTASSEFEGDRGYTERFRGSLTLRDGTGMNRVAGVIEEGGFAMTLETIESQLPVSGNAFLTLLFMGYDDRLEQSGFAETAAQSLSFEAGPAAGADDPAPDASLVLLEGALIIDGLPEDWSRFNERDNVVSFSSAGGYQGFITIETGRRATIAADLSTSFTGTPTERRGEIMGVTARIFEGRQSHDAFLQGFNMVAGSRFMELPDLCLPDGEPLAITWAGSPQWFERGAFDRLFDAARFEGLVSCDAEPVAPSASSSEAMEQSQHPPEAAPAESPTQAQPGPEPAPPAKPERVTTPQPQAPRPADPEALGGTELQAEILFWESVREIDVAAAYEAYLNQWPEGQFADLARLRLSASGTAQPVPDAQTPASLNDAAALTLCEQQTEGSIADPFAAIAACRAAVASLPYNPDLHYRLARALQAGGADAEAIEHLQQAADGGLASAMTALALAYRQGQGVAPDDAQAVRWYRAGAEAGDALAMNNLGYMYGQGLGGLRPDAAEAASWYLRAANAGSVFAMNNIGRFYLDGRGVVQDYGQARYWLQRGAEAGHPPAMNNLGGMYAMGQGGPIDHRQAMVRFRRAADEGHAPAMANVALAYSNGQGVARDPEQAALWFEQSIRGGAGASVLGVLDGLPRPVIRALQQRLRLAGVYAGAVDGVVGPQTRNAVHALDGLGG